MNRTCKALGVVFLLVVIPGFNAPEAQVPVFQNGWKTPRSATRHENRTGLPGADSGRYAIAF